MSCLRSHSIHIHFSQNYLLTLNNRQYFRIKYQIHYSFWWISDCYLSIFSKEKKNSLSNIFEMFFFSPSVIEFKGIKIIWWEKKNTNHNCLPKKKQQTETSAINQTSAITHLLLFYFVSSVVFCCLCLCSIFFPDHFFENRRQFFEWSSTKLLLRGYSQLIITDDSAPSV